MAEIDILSINNKKIQDVEARKDIQVIKENQINLLEDDTSMEGISDTVHDTLETDDKRIIGGINEVNAKLKDIANLFSTEQTTNSYKIKCGNKVIAEIPLGSASPSTESFGNILSSITTWNVMGNSITDETINPTTKYPTILKNKYTNITTVNNYAHNGWHVAVKSGTGYNSFLTLIDSMSSSCDLITVAGGVNDFIQSVPIGECSSTLDTEFYGAVNNLITRLKSKYPNAIIIWIIPIPMKNGVFGTNSDGTNKIGKTLDDYRKALRNKLNDLNVKCIDLSTDINMDYSKISTDGLHPTANGHQIYASELEKSIPLVPLAEQVIECTNITLDKSTLTFTTTDSQTLVATKTPSNATNIIVWSIDNNTIASVVNGVVTPLKNGSCVITATCGSKSATCNVTVSGISEPIDTKIYGSNYSYTTGGFINTDGKFRSFDGYAYSEKIPMEANKKINVYSNLAVPIAYYNSNGDWISTVTNSGVTWSIRSLTTPENCAYCVLNYQSVEFIPKYYIEKISN